MKSFRKVLSVVLALSMVLGMMTGINVSAADADIIYEDFGSDFVIDNANKTITTESGLTVTAHDKIYALNKLAVTDNGLFVPAPAGDGDKKGVDFTFEPITEGITEISFDLNVTAVGYSHNSELGKLYGTQEDGATVKEANRGFNSPAQTSSSGKNVFFGSNLVAAQGEKFRATYVIDYTEGKIETLVNGISLATENILNSVTSIDTLKFFDDYNPDAYYIDNLTIVRNADANQKTITFEGIDGVEAITATYGRAITLPIPEVDGQVFGGWLDEYGEAIEGTILLTEDVTLTADVREIQIYRETFDNFDIDYDNKRITTDSGFSVGASDDAYGFADKMKVENGTLKNIGMTYNNTAYNTNMYFDFEPIIAGTAKISFDVNPISWGGSAGHSGIMFAIGNENSQYFHNMSQGAHASTNSIAYIQNSTSSYGKGLVLNGATGLKTQWTNDWVKVEFIITMPDAINGTDGSYDVYIDGELAAEAVAFVKPLTSISRIHIVQGQDSGSEGGATGEYRLRNSNNYFDNITLVENAAANKKTITFMDGTNVHEEKEVVIYGDTTFPVAPVKDGQTFLGWFTEADEEVTAEMLTNVTENATYYAKFRGAALYRETFDTFTIDNDAKTVTTTSGLDVSATDALYAFKPAITDGMLYVKGYDNYVASTTETNGQMKFTFPEVKGGKTYIAVDLAMTTPGFSNWMSVWGTPHLTIGDGTNDAAKLYFRGTASQGQNTEVYLASSNASGGTTGNVIGTITKGADAKRIEYVIDMDAKTYSVTWNGQTTENIAFAGNVEALSTVTLQFAVTDTKNKNCNLKFDNLTVVENPDANKKTVTFMDGNEELEVFDVVVYGNVEYMAPAKGDMIFLGWTNADGEAVTEDAFKGITEDATYYANYRERVKLKETFGSGFVLDNDAKTVTTNSGFAVSATDALYAFKPAITDGMLYIKGYDNYVASTTETNGKMTFTFPEIKSGKARVAVDLSMPQSGFSNWMQVWGTPHLTIGDGTNNAAQLYFRGSETSGQNTEVYLATKNEASAQTTNVIGTITKGANAQELVYFIDMDAKTYSVTWNGQTTENIAFAGNVEALSTVTLQFAVTDTKNKNCNLKFDDLSVIENYTDADAEPEVAKYTVNFYNEDGSQLLYTTTVEEGETALYAGATPTKAGDAQTTYTFAGWDKALTNITANTDVYATFTSAAVKYTVTFVDHDGTTLGTSTVAYGTAATAPADPTREGYTFTGWDVDFTNVTADMTVTAQYKENEVVVPDVTTDGYFDSTIEPMSLADAAAVFGAQESDLAGLYAWKIKHSISGVELSKSGNSFAGYTGKMLGSIQVSLEFGDDVGAYVDARPIQSESTINNLLFGMDRVNDANSYNTYIDPTIGNAENCFPYTTTETLTSVDDAIVTVLVTNTNTFSLEIYGECDINEYYADKTYNDVAYSLNTNKEQVKIWQDKNFEDYHYAERRPVNLTVESGTITSGGVGAPVEPATKYTVKFYQSDDEADMTLWGEAQEVEEGAAAVAPETNPTKAEDDTYTYTFKAWDKDFTNVTSNLDIRPIFEATAKPVEPENTFTYVWGDVTGDGEITAADVTAIYTTFAGGTGISSGGYVVGEKLYGSDYVWGDVTGDGEITAADVTAVYTTFAGGTGISSGGYVVGTDKITITY